MSTASQGRYTEHRVRDHMAERGWTWIMTAAASKGAGDLLMGHEVHGAALVQVGRRSKRLGPADRARLLHAADLCCALPILAVCEPRREPRYWLVSADVPRTWDEWTPKTDPTEETK